MRTLFHPNREEIQLESVLYALSDPIRLQIVVGLTERPEQPCAAIGVPVSKSTVSHHFKVLREAGVIHVRVEGTQRLVSLRCDDLEARFPGLLTAVLRGVKRDE